MTSGVEVSHMAGNHSPLLGLPMGCKGKCENCGQQRQALPAKPVAHRIIHVVAPVSHCSPSDHATAWLEYSGPLNIWLLLVVRGHRIFIEPQ